MGNCQFGQIKHRTKKRNLISITLQIIKSQVQAKYKIPEK